MSNEEVIKEILDVLASMNNMEQYCDKQNYCMHCTCKAAKVDYIMHLRKKVIE